MRTSVHTLPKFSQVISASNIAPLVLTTHISYGDYPFTVGNNLCYTLFDMARLINLANLPFLFLHEMIHYLVARALGVDAELHSRHLEFYPESHGNAVILAITLAPCAVGIMLLLATAVFLLIAPQLWIIPVHAGLFGLWLVISSLSDIHVAYIFFREGYWPTVENPAQSETVEQWFENRLRSKM